MDQVDILEVTRNDEGVLGLRLASHLDGTIDKSQDLIQATSRHLAIGGQAPSGPSSGRDFSSFGGSGPADKKYSEALLRMVQGSNRTEAMSSSKRIDVAGSILAISTDEDPPVVSKGRAS